MPVVTIVILGAGETAAATAQQLAAARVASRVVMVDEAAGVAQGKALDIAQAAPVDRYDTAVAGTGDETAVVGAAVVIVADRASGAEWADEAGLALVQRAARLNDRAAIICAGVRQRSVIHRAVHEAGLARARVFGTAPEALRAAVCSMVALDTETSPADISLLVVGRPPDDVIVPWDAASLSGRRALDVLPPPAITRIESRLGRLWPPGPYALGAAAARVVGTMLTRTPRPHVLDVTLLRGESDGGQPAMLPVRVGPRGIVQVDTPTLSSRDRVRFESALAR